MIFRHRRYHVLTARSHNNFFLTAHNRQVAAFIKAGQVSGFKPAVFSKCGGVFLRVLIVSIDHTHAAHLQFTVFGNTPLRSR